MERVYEADELDQETLEYLQLAHKHLGRGLPGVYLSARQAGLSSHTLPIWAAVCGPVVLALTLLLSWGATRDPVGVALFMTGGLFLGGWLFLAWVRTLLARSRATYLGYFQLVDPLYLWEAHGTNVKVSPVDKLTNVERKNQFEGDAFKSASLWVELADRTLTLRVYSQGKSHALYEFLTELLDVQHGSPAERGYEALERSRQIDRERYDDEDDEDDEDGGSRKRLVAAIPQPQRARPVREWLAYLVLVGSATALFFFCWWLAGVLRDDALFAAVKDQQPQQPAMPGDPNPAFRRAAELRSYLIDPRNRRHRDEVAEMLGQIYAPIAERVEKGGADSSLSAGLAEIIRSLRARGRPVITVHFVRNEDEKKAGAPEQYLSAAVLETMNGTLVKEMAEHLGNLIGKEMADYAEVMEPPAHITLTPRVEVKEAGGGGNGLECKVEWTIEAQALPDGSKTYTTKRTSEMRMPNEKDRARLVRAVYRRFGDEFRQMLLSKAAAPPR